MPDAPKHAPKLLAVEHEHTVPCALKREKPLGRRRPAENPHLWQNCLTGAARLTVVLEADTLQGSTVYMTSSLLLRQQQQQDVEKDRLR